MTGVAIVLEGADEALAVLGRALGQTEDTLPLYDALAALIESRTRRRIAEEKAGPGGVAWAPWSPAYAESRHAGQSLLRGEGALLDSIQSIATATSAEIGSNLVYAAIHQAGGTTRPHEIRPKHTKALAFGGGVFAKVSHPGSKIPARPFLGLDDEDGVRIEELVGDWLLGPGGLNDVA